MKMTIWKTRTDLMTAPGNILKPLLLTVIWLQAGAKEGHVIS